MGYHLLFDAILSASWVKLINFFRVVVVVLIIIRFNPLLWKELLSSRFLLQQQFLWGAKEREKTSLLIKTKTID